jgi:hypothetical protein
MLTATNAVVETAALNYLRNNQLQLRETNNTIHQTRRDQILHPSALGSKLVWQQKLQQSIAEK